MTTVRHTRSSSGRIAGAIALALIGCREDPPPPAPTPRNAATAEFRQRANAEALRDAAPVVVEALALADPVADHQARGTPLRAAWPDSTGTSALKDARDRAIAATSHGALDPEMLSPRDAMVLLTMRFGLDRLRDRGPRRPRERASPMLVVRDLERWLTEVRYLDAHGRCDDACVTSVRDTAKRSSAATERLAAVSEAELRGTLGALTELAGNVARHADRSSDPLAEALRELAAALAAWRTRLEAVEIHLPRATAIARGEPMPNPVDASGVARLPDRLGPAMLRSGLEFEEHLLVDSKALYEALGAALARITAMLGKRGAVELGVRRPVDLARCETEAARLRAWASRQPAVAAATFDCAAALRWLGPDEANDGELRVALTEFMIVEPTERARRAEELDALALCSGEFAPLGHRRALTLAVLTGVGDQAGTTVALGRAHDELCLAAAALWLHAEFDEHPSPSFVDTCPQRTAQAWEQAALADPWGSLRGLGLMRLGSGPAEIVALERFWWAPLGLVDRLAAPRAATDVPVRTKVETIEPPPPRGSDGD